MSQTGRQVEALPKFKSVANINPSAAYWVYRILESHPALTEYPGQSEELLALAEKQGHLIARRIFIQRQIKGREGFKRIPIGFARLARLMFDVFRAGYRKDELLYN